MKEEDIAPDMNVLSSKVSYRERLHELEACSWQVHTQQELRFDCDRWN